MKLSKFFDDYFECVRTDVKFDFLQNLFKIQHIKKTAKPFYDEYKIFFHTIAIGFIGKIDQIP